MRRLAIFIGITLVIVITFLPREQEPVPPPANCLGYTVLDHDRVITCKGDTVEYNWKPRL